MTVDGPGVREALLGQWHRLAEAVPGLDLSRPSRVERWRNREVVAHLCLQPILLGRFLATESDRQPSVDVAANLAGTGALGDLVDASATRAARRGELDLAGAVAGVVADLRAARLEGTIVTLQGPISLVDYLVTRCVEAVVHGGDLVEPVPPVPEAEALAAAALGQLLARRAPHLVDRAEELGATTWIELATGRAAATGELGEYLPLMT